MSSWKKVLVSGSSIEVNQISASGVPITDNESNLLVIDSNGSITQMDQSNVAGTNPTFNIEAINIASSTVSDFDTGADYLIFSASEKTHGFGFTHTTSGNTSSIALQTPQDLTTDANVHFQSLKVDQYISHAGDAGSEDTFISFEDNKIRFNAGGVEFVEFDQNATQNAVNINDGGADVDFRVEGDTDTHLLFTDANKDKVAIGTNTVDSNSLLTVDGRIKVGGITGSFPQAAASSKHMLVLNNSGDGGASGRVEFRDISVDINAATASFSSSVVGTADEVEVTSPIASGDIVIGLPDDVTITSDLTVGDNLDLTGGNVTISGNISASGNITASNIRVDNDIALGGNIFSFSGFSFIEGISANFTGSNKFGSGSTPAANDTAGGGIAHQFTGSVAITGSGLTIIAGGVTATDNTGSFGYLTAPEISSSGNLFASLSNDDSLVTDAVVVYDNATGQFFTTASAGVGVTDYTALTGIPANIVSASSLSTGNAQGEYDFTVNGVVQNDNISSGLASTNSPQFASLTLTGNLVATGSVSASGNLFAKVENSSTTSFKTVVYDPTTGKFHSTGSYGGGGGAVNYDDITGTPPIIVSSSLLTSNNQGAITASINGVTSSFDVGLTIGDSPTFSSITATGNLSVAGTSTLTGNTTIAGDLIVNGTTTTIATDNLQIEDTFILLASGSAGDSSLNDGGIIVEQTAAGAGVALYWDTSEQNWSIDKAGANHALGGGGVTADVNVLTVQLVANSGVAPTSTPIMGIDGSANGAKGHFYVDTNDEFGVYVYT